MSAGLHLRVTTPLALVLEAADVASIRAEDASGGFGIQPGHADFLTVLGASVLRWRRHDGDWSYCALKGGVLRVTDGNRVEVACRMAVPGDDLPRLEALIRQKANDADDQSKRSRGEQTRLHAAAIRRLMHGLDDSGRGGGMESLMEDFQ